MTQDPFPTLAHIIVVNPAVHFYIHDQDYATATGDEIKGIGPLLVTAMCTCVNCENR